MKAEQDLVAATAAIGVAQAQRFPQLALTGQAGEAQLSLSGVSATPFATFAG